MKGLLIFAPLFLTACQAMQTVNTLTPEELALPFGSTPQDTSNIALDLSDDLTLMQAKKACVEIPQQLPGLDPGTKRSIRTCTNNTTGEVTVTSITIPCYQVELDSPSYLNPTGQWYLSTFKTPLYSVAELQAAAINESKPQAGAAVRKINHCEHIIVGDTGNLLQVQSAEDLLAPDQPSI